MVQKELYVVSTRLGQEEHEWLKDRAESQQRSLAKHIRFLILEDLKRARTYEGEL